MRVGAADSQRACAQHAALVRALDRAGARVLRLPFLHGAFDSVFMKDSAILIDRGGRACALPTTFRHGQRRVESAARARQLARAGFTVARAARERDRRWRRPCRRAPRSRSPRARRAVGARFDDRPRVLPRLRGRAARAPRSRAVPSRYRADRARRRHARVLQRSVHAGERARARGAALEAHGRGLARRGEEFAINIVEVRGTIITGTDTPAAVELWRSLGRRSSSRRSISSSSPAAAPRAWSRGSSHRCRVHAAWPRS